MTVCTRWHSCVASTPNREICRACMCHHFSRSSRMQAATGVHICMLTSPGCGQCNSHTCTPLTLLSALPMAQTPCKKDTITSWCAHKVLGLHSEHIVYITVFHKVLACCSWAGGTLQHNVMEAPRRTLARHIALQSVAAHQALIHHMHLSIQGLVHPRGAQADESPQSGSCKAARSLRSTTDQ